MRVRPLGVLRNLGLIGSGPYPVERFTADAADRLVEDVVVEHYVAAKYKRVGDLAGDRRAADNDAWLSAHGTAFREKVRAFFRSDEKRMSWRAEAIATHGRQTPTWIATHEVNVFPMPVEAVERLVRMGEDGFEPFRGRAAE